MLVVGSLAGFWQRLEAAYRMPIKHLPPFHRLSHRSGARKGVAVLAITTLSIGWMIIATYRLSVLEWTQYWKVYPDTAQWALEHLPAGALIWSSRMSGAIYYYTQFPIVRFDFIDRDKASVFLIAASAAQRPMYAFLSPDEIDAMMSRVGGRWTKIKELRGSISIFEYAG